jgi:predicted nucleotidyltransferase component of viral defense system
MFELTETKIKKWSAEIGIADLGLSELDMRLTNALNVIYSDKFLSSRLYLKGGTAINKLYLQKTARLSVDLDFNSIGGKEDVMAQRNKVRDKIMLLLREQDEDYTMKKKDTYEQTTIKVGYKPAFGPSKQYMKVEISNIERFPVLGKALKEFKVPDSRDMIKINTYFIEELIATKLRALYDRLKGRDIYDLYFLSSLGFDRIQVRKLVLYYFYRSKKIFNPILFFKNINNKFLSKKYVDDVSTFARADVPFSIDTGVVRLLSSYSFLREFDVEDKDFLILARHLLGKPVKKTYIKRILEIEYPLRHLFKNDSRLSAEALNKSVEDIKLKINK